MPTQVSYPGVYIEEVPSGVRTITGVATSITAFLGRAVRGPVNEATTITSYTDFERTFGGLKYEYPMSYAVRDFFLNGGGQAVIVRLFHPTFESQSDEITRRPSVATPLLTRLSTTFTTEIAKISETDIKKFLKEYQSKAAEQQAILKRQAFEVSAATDSVWKKAVEASILQKANAGTVKSAIKSEVEQQNEAYTSNPYIAKVFTEVGSAAENVADDKPAGAVLDAIDAPSTFRKASVREAIESMLRYLNGVTNAAAKAEEAIALNSTMDAVKKFLGTRLANSTPGAIIAAASSFAPGEIARIDASGLKLQASSNGSWANPLKITSEPATNQEIADRLGVALSSLFNLSVQLGEGGPQERFTNLSIGNNPYNVQKVLKAQSQLIRVVEGQPLVVPASHGEFVVTELADDGKALEPNDYQGDEAEKKGQFALEKTDLFNILCIPEDQRGEGTDSSIYQVAVAYCKKRRAMLLVDSHPDWEGQSGANTLMRNPRKQLGDKLNLAGSDARNAAVFFPRIRQADPERDGQIDTFVPCGMIAGIMARTDATRGVWKAPAGLDASLNGIHSLSVKLTDAENGILNPVGINCLRSFPASGNVVWGARTLRGDDQLGDEYKYIPIRRTALFIEESLYRGTQWVVFEPNDEPLWAQIRLNIGAFMHDLFRQGAFQGRSPREAYFVKCDKETTTQNDINRGIVNVVVGFAPLKPAEFVVIKLTQIAGQIES